MTDLANGLYDLHSLHEPADFFALSDDRFWNTLDVVHRILVDAAGLKETWQTRGGEQVMREETEKHQEENETKEKIVRTWFSRTTLKRWR